MPLTNSEYETLLRSYDEKRTRAERVLARRRAEVYASVPAIRELDETVASEAVREARRRILSGSNIQESTGSPERFSKERAALLTGAGYPADYLDPPYECTICSDTGYADGRKCVCFAQAEAALLSEREHLGAILEEENFDTFSLAYYSETMTDPVSGQSARQLAANALSAAKRSASLLGAGKCNVYIYGKAGLGKTFLTHCIAREAKDRGLEALYFSAPALVELLGEISFSRTGDAAFERRALREADVLLIDDLGTELTNTFVASQLFRIVNERLLSGRSTVISSNLSLPQLRDTYSDRLYSRIASGYTVIRLIGEEIRIKKRLAGIEKGDS